MQMPNQPIRWMQLSAFTHRQDELEFKFSTIMGKKGNLSDIEKGTNASKQNF